MNRVVNEATSVASGPFEGADRARMPRKSGSVATPAIVGLGLGVAPDPDLQPIPSSLSRSVLPTFKRLALAGLVGLGVRGERRRSTRTMARLPADVVDRCGYRVRGLIGDVSAGGLQLRLTKEQAADLAPGEIRVDVYNPFIGDGGGSLTIWGRLVHTRGSSDGGVRLGVRLDHAGNMWSQTVADVTAVPGEWEIEIQRLVEHIHLELPREGCRILAFTGVSQALNVGTIARWLALSLACRPRGRVLYVEANLGPGRTEASGGSRGLVELLRGDALEHVVRHTSLTALDLVIGSHGDSEVMMLTPEADLKRALERLRTEYDYIVVNAPAVDRSPFSHVLARNADGSFFVVPLRSAPRDTVTDALDQLKHYGGRLLGVIVDRTEP